METTDLCRKLESWEYAAPTRAGLDSPKIDSGLHALFVGQVSVELGVQNSRVVANGLSDIEESNSSALEMQAKTTTSYHDQD